MKKISLFLCNILYFKNQIIFVWNFSRFSLNIKQISYLSLWLTTVPLTFIMGPDYKPCLSLLRDNALFIPTVVWICCFPPFLLSINYYRTLIKYSKITLYSSLINMEFLPLWKYYFDFYFFFKFQRIESCMYWRSIHKWSKDYWSYIPQPAEKWSIWENLAWILYLKSVIKDHKPHIN